MPDTRHVFDQDVLAATALRDEVAAIAARRGGVPTFTNGEKLAFVPPVSAFHKGLPHDRMGRPDPAAYAIFRDALEDHENAEGYARFDVPLGPVGAPGAHRPAGFVPAQPAVASFSTITASGAPVSARAWESPLAGHQNDLQGPDPSGLAMAPAPRLGGSELTAELAELYAMAILRDTHVGDLDAPATPVRGGLTVGGVIDALAGLAWFDPAQTPADQGTQHEARRRSARGIGTRLDAATLFRGSTEGARSGPYISQFLLVGSPARGRGAAMAGQPDANRLSDAARDGFVTFGAQRIDQRINAQLQGRDYMTSWPLWLDVQNGADLREQDAFEPDGRPCFVGRLRDLATYVHVDQLYQAYFNAALLLMANGVPFDYGFPSGKPHATRGSFATFGGPHLLSLLTEVASRALKAVRLQKFQHHLRGRPEQLAAMLTLSANGRHAALGNAAAALAAMNAELSACAPALLNAIHAINTQQNAARDADPTIFPRTGTVPGGLPAIAGRNLLLPMAFPEGSPMHPSYGAGHATVAGACVTVLKAFFELSTADPGAPGVARPTDLAEARSEPYWTPRGMDTLPRLDRVYVASADRLSLVDSGVAPASLSIEGELDKLAANIAIGRNMAGVHFFSDYYDSLRMGERLALGILQEQAATYTDPLTMRLRSFDGDRLIVEGNGAGGATVHVRRAGAPGYEDYLAEWWTRHAGAEFA